MLRVGIDIGGTKTHLAAFDASGNVHYQQKITSHAALTTGSTPATALADHVQAFLQQAGVLLAGIEAIAVGIPGITDQQSGHIIDCPNLTILNGSRLGVELEHQLGIPTLLEKDVNLIGLSEHLRGRGAGVDEMACLFIGSGLGSALILRGELYRGADGLSGEVGHITVEPHGLPCTCGGVGCLEMYCSGKALTVRAPEILNVSRQSLLTADSPWQVAQDVITAARSGHGRARQALEESFFYLGVGIVTLINALNLRLIVLGGGIVNGFPEGIEIVRRVVSERGRVGTRDKLEIDFAQLTDLPHIVGANFLIDQYLARGQS